MRYLISVICLLLVCIGVRGETEILPVADRTSEVRDAIVATTGVDSATEVTATHLAEITSLNLRNKAITELKFGDFSGLTGLTSLNLYNNELSSLPNGIFEGLTSLTSLRLGSNAVDPLPISVTVEKVGEDQFKVVVPTGAPFDIVVPISAANATVSDDETTLTISKGSIDSSALLTLTRTADTTAAVTVNIGTLPSLPTDHYGYTLTKPDTLPIEVISAVTETDTTDITETTDTTDTLETPENSAPEFSDGTTTIRYIAENTAADSNIGSAVSATDADEDNLTYSLSGIDAASFDIDSTTGQLKTKAPLDYETKRVYTVTISVSDDSLTDTITVIIGVIDVVETVLVSTVLPVSDRTAQVRDAIVAAVSSVNDAEDITDTHLAEITSLDFRSAGITELKTGDFSGLTGLTNLNLYGNMLNSLPVGIFDGLTSLTNLRLGGNQIDPFPLNVSLQQVDVNQFKAVIFAGAPFDVELSINGASITSTTIPKGSLESAVFTATTSDVNIGVLPTLPANHFGYILAKSTVCNRTIQVSDAIVEALQGIDDCRNVSDVHLATITSLDMSGMSVSTLNSDDFTGLLSLTSLNLSNNQLDSLPDGIFVGLTSLTTLDLSGNTVDPLPFTISLQKVGTNMFKASLPSGAPSDIVLPITVTSGNLADNVTTITIPAGSIESLPLTVLRASNTFAAVTVDIGSLPILPIGHTGYAFAKSNDLPIEIFETINTAPVFADGTATTREVDENTEAGTNIGTAITASDAENNTLTYSLGGTDASAFDIDSSTGQLKTKSALDYEATTFYVVTITVSDGVLSDSINVTINVVDIDEETTEPQDTQDETETKDTDVPNRAPTFTEGNTTTRSVAENTASGVNIGTAVGATDADEDDTLTYSLSGTDASSFGIDSSSGQLRTSAALDYETKRSYTVIISVSDGNKGTDTITVTIKITDVDETTNSAPEFSEGSSATRSIDENTATDVSIGTAVEATDEDNDTLTYSLGGTDASSFSIDDTTGQLKTSAALNYETKASYAVTVSVSDSNGGSASINVTINVVDVNEAPTFTAGTSTTRSITENTATGVNIGSAVAATDPENDTLTYTLDGDDKASFDIESTTGQLKTKAYLDYETKSSYSVTVKVSDNSLTDSIAVSISIRDLDETPSNIAPEFSDGTETTRSVAENTTSDANIGDPVSASDEDSETLAYQLGGTDASSFAIDDKTGQIKTSASLNYEDDDAYEVTVTVSDGSLTDTISVTINVTNVNEAPVFSEGDSTIRSVAENTSAGTAFGAAFSVTDPDANTTLTYTFGGTDAAAFSFNSNTRRLQTKAALDYEDKSSYQVTLTVSDGSLTDVITVNISVTDEQENVVRDPNRAPVFTEGSSTTRSVAENTGSGVDIGNPIAATDQDTTDTLTYTLGGTDASSFGIDSTTGQLRTSGDLDFENKNSYSVSITVSDGELSDSITVTITVTDLPVFTDGSSATREIAEDTASGVNIGAPVTAIVVGNDEFIYQIGGTDASSFSIDSATGQIKTAADLDFENKSTYSVTVRVVGADNETANIQVTIKVIDANDVPTFTEGATTSRAVDENSPIDTNIGQPVSATDLEGDTITYTLRGPDRTSFDIDHTTGQITMKNALDHETKSTYTVRVVATDTNSGSSSITVTISVRDVNDAPTFVDGESATRSVPETTAVDTAIGGPIAATDQDGDTITYSLGGTDAASFDFDTSTGQLKTKDELDVDAANAQTTYSVTVTATEDSGEENNSTTIPVTINVTAVNERPVFTTAPTTIDIDNINNLSDGDAIGDAYVAVDPEGETITYSVVVVGDLFDIDSETGQLKATTELIDDRRLSYSFRVFASVVRQSSWVDVTVNVTRAEPNNAPVFDEGETANRSVGENTLSNTPIGDPVSATDADENDTLTYSLEDTDTDAASFDINSSTGQLKTKDELDYETKSIYTVTVKVTDAAGATDTIIVTINITDESGAFVPVSDRTQQIRDAILDAITDVDDAADVTAEHLAAITSLSYSAPGISDSIYELMGGDFSGLTGLTSLSLTGNIFLESLPDNIFDDLTSLQKLDLEVNGIDSLQDSVFDSLTQLTSLDISYNSLTTLPDGIFDSLTLLTSLDTEGNYFETVPDVIADLTSLETLSLAGNDFTALPDGLFDDMSSLKVLNLGGGDIETFASDDFEGLTALEEINLSYNEIASLPAGLFDSLSGITNLPLNNNKLTTVPSSVFDNLTALTNLNLSENGLASLPSDAFDGLSALTNLTLSNNKLTTLPSGIFDPLTSLVAISLERNELSSLPGTIFQKLTSLTTLNMRSNKLTTFPNGLFVNLTALNYLYLSQQEAGELDLTVTLEKVENNKFKIVIPAGAPYPMTAQVWIVKGYVGDETGPDRPELTIAKGNTDSETITIARDDKFDWDEVSVILQTVTDPPSHHSGYTLTDPPALDGFSEPAGAPSNKQQVPKDTAFLPNFPNPFNPETWIPYQLSESADVMLTIYNMRGVVVRELAIGHQNAGFYTSRSRAAHWDGRNNIGEKVATGVYFVTIRAGDFYATQKMLIRK